MRNLFFLALAAIMLFSCKKQDFTYSRDALLRTDVDTLHYDTVFTTAGSVSQVFKIFNDNAKAIRVSQVRLAGGQASSFKINVDGTPGPTVENLEIAAQDSAYIFVTVSIDPNTAHLPFVVRDSIEMRYNGNTQWLQLDAYGQNAHFLKNKTISADETWNNDLPYVILGRLEVAANATLSINQGCKILMHADAPFIINGSLQVKGDRYDSTRVLFSGDRLDEPYRNFPASYPGLVFTASSRNNQIRYAMIRNAYQGIVATESDGTVKLRLEETVIDNAYDAGLLGVHTSIDARNLLISNCGKDLLLVKGGSYNFTHCTIAAYSNNEVPHKEPVLLASNYLNLDNNLTTGDLNAHFENCIFWGQSGGLVKNEILLARQGNTAFNVSFHNVLWPLTQKPDQATSVTGTVINNQDPQFVHIDIGNRQYDFHLGDHSPAKDRGSDAGVTMDLDGNPRPVGLPDLGAYEKQ